MQIGKAIWMYKADWNDTYPTNRAWTSPGKLGPITPRVKLSPRDMDGQGETMTFAYGVNWVESLYRYIENVTRGGSLDGVGEVWRCGSVTNPEISKAGTTYVFNRNLIEQRETNVRNRSNLMMIREMDRLVDSELRPINDSHRSSEHPPMSPFLTRRDPKYGLTQPQIHGPGSFVLFADGHVKRYDSDFYPDALDAAHCWDGTTRQWYNLNNSQANRPASSRLTIAVTP
jgi:prepilin-type processing-associated H-X9-DG protein